MSQNVEANVLKFGNTFKRYFSGLDMLDAVEHKLTHTLEPEGHHFPDNGLAKFETRR